jgi:anti-sigma B factor antagonist
MNAELTICEQVATVRVSGELDAYTAPQVRDQMVKALEQGTRWVVADLTATEYIDSIFLGILVGLGKRAGEQDGDITVICDREHLLRVFDVSGTRELLNVVGTAEDAKALIAGWQSAAGIGGDDDPDREEEDS